MRFHFKIALSVAVVVGAALAAVLMLPGGEKKAIENLLRDAARAAERGDADAVVGLLSPGYRSGDQDYEAMARRLRAEIAPRRHETVELDCTVETRGAEAVARVRLKVKAGPSESGEAQFTLRLRKEGGAWKIASAEEIR